MVTALACGVPGLTSPAAPTTAPDLNATLQMLAIVQTQTALAGGQVVQNETLQMTAVTQEASQEPLPTETGLPTSTSTPIPTQTFTPTSTPKPCNWAGNVIDVNYPDEVKVPGNTNFVKTWRLTNYGSCTWTSGYSLIFYSGDNMSGPASVPLTSGTVPPGGNIEVSINLKAPSAKGTYQGFYKLRAPDGSVFGIGSGMSDPFWVLIKVPAPTAAPLPDLEITALNACASPKKGVPCTFKVSVYNSGDVAVTDMFKVKLYVGTATDAKCAWDINGLVKNGGYVKTCDYTFPSWYGSIAIRAVADPAGAIPDKDDSNDSMTIYIAVSN